MNVFGTEKEKYSAILELIQDTHNLLNIFYTIRSCEGREEDIYILERLHESLIQMGMDLDVGAVNKSQIVMWYIYQLLSTAAIEPHELKMGTRIEEGEDVIYVYLNVSKQRYDRLLETISRSSKQEGLDGGIFVIEGYRVMFLISSPMFAADKKLKIFI